MYDSDVRDLGRWYELSQMGEWNDDMNRGRGSFGNSKLRGRARPQSSQAVSDKDIKSLRLLRSNPRKDQSEI